MGRFVNADAVISGADGSVQGKNVFAYCFNNPTNLDDSSGNWPKMLKKAAKAVKNVVKKALEIHNNVAMLKRCKTKQQFRDLLNAGFKLTYEAQCILDVDMYKIFKELGNTLDERAVDFHLSKVGHMAKEILSENREFSVDDWKIIMKNKSLTSWCHNRC